MLSRSFRTIVADMDDLQERLDFLIETAQRYESALSDSASGSPTQLSPSYTAIENLVCLRSRNCIWKRWVANYEERTQLMMHLFFSIASQMDNRNNLNIANLTSKIAIETKRDSSSMITIAAVTMVFLPGTFISVSHVLSVSQTTHINSSPGNLQYGFLQPRYESSRTDHLRCGATAVVLLCRHHSTDRLGFRDLAMVASKAGG